MKKHHDESSPFKALETHFLNAFHSGLYISAAEMANIGAKHAIEIPLKNRELIIKKLLNDAKDKSILTAVIADLSALINDRIDHFSTLATNYPAAAPFVQLLKQKATSSNLFLLRQQKVNPYE